VYGIKINNERKKEKEKEQMDKEEDYIMISLKKSSLRKGRK
jgi:hypothetical protein